MTYEMISTPASVENVEEMLQCIYEASSTARLLASMGRADGGVMDMDAITEIGNVITRLLSQPMECVGQVISEKQAASGRCACVAGDALRRVKQASKQGAFIHGWGAEQAGQRRRHTLSRPRLHHPHRQVRAGILK